MKFWKVKKEGERKVEYFTEKYLNKLTLEEAKFILEHAEKQLKDTLETNSLIVGRTTTLLTITVGLMVALVGFAINKWELNQCCNVICQTACFELGYLFILALLLIRNIQPRKYISIGARPKSFFVDVMFNLDKEKRLLHIYANEIESYQTRIQENHLVNEGRWKMFKRCLQLITFSPLVLITIYLLCNYFIHH